MLVNKKQGWDIYQQPEVPSVKKSNVVKVVKPDVALRVKCLTMAVMTIGIAMFLTASSEAIIRSGYELVQMKLQVMKLEKENEQLQLEIAKLRSPQRIQSIATNELGMVMPKNVYFAETSSPKPGVNPEKEKSLASIVFGRKEQ